MAAPVPIYRSQGNTRFGTDRQDSSYARGQTVPYDVNGSPTAPPDEPGFLIVKAEDLPSADPAVPLLEFEVPPGVLDVVFNSSNAITARVAATSPTVFPIQKNGAANGDITVTGSTGVMSLSDSTYAPGDLFALYPPATPDATLDGLRASLGVN
jgi:hypothetical protein